MADEYKLFNIAASLIRNAGYHAEIRALTNDAIPRMALVVQDPVKRSAAGGMLEHAGIKEVRIYNNRGDSVLRGACRFVEERS